jgi:iron complex outermembrane receptor protein
VALGTTDLALSPSVVGAAIFTYRPVQNAKVQLMGKYVCKQYADNTGLEAAKLDPYFLLNARLAYTFNMRHGNELECQLAVNNILNHNYRTNAWCGAYYDTEGQTVVTDRGYFQQPGINFTARVIYRF